MNWEYKITIGIIILEFSLVIAIALSACFLKVFYFFNAKRKKKILFNIEVYLKKIILQGDPLNVRHFPHRWKKLEDLIQIIKQFDQTSSNTHWEKVRIDFIHSILLPLARKQCGNRHWISRFYSAEAFTFGVESQDEECIIQLINDEVPLVHLKATSAALLFASKATINAVINRMSRKRWITKSTFIQAFDNASENIKPFILKRLKSTKYITIKTTCYTLLMKFKPEKTTWNVMEDIESKDIDLKLAAIKFLAYSDKESAIPILISLLKDSAWEVRLVAIHRLGKLKAIHAIDEIANCLNDSQWWVKMSAAETLKEFGERGENALKKIDPHFEFVSFDISKHIANTWW